MPKLAKTRVSKLPEYPFYNVKSGKTVAAKAGRPGWRWGEVDSAQCVVQNLIAGFLLEFYRTHASQTHASRTHASRTYASPTLPMDARLTTSRLADSRLTDGHQDIDALHGNMPEKRT